MKGPTVKRDDTWKDWRVGLIGIGFLLACVTWQVNTNTHTPTPHVLHDRVQSGL